MTKTQLWRTALPSLLLLIGVFFFINSACLRGSSSDDYVAPCGGPNATAPAGATVRILEPRADQVIAAPRVDDRVEVLIRLEASGIKLAPEHPCEAGTAHFVLTFERVPEPCPALSPGPIDLQNAETQTVKRLNGGTYMLHARLVAPNGQLYQPTIEASVRFTVQAPALPDAGCP